jgi:(hydroxyamino)benzene mutase
MFAWDLRRIWKGVMNGIFLLALGAIWAQLRLPSPAKATAYWTALYGTYVNWLTTTLAAVFGTAALSPISAAGHRGQPWQESLVTAGFMSVGIAIVASSVLILWGLRARTGAADSAVGSATKLNAARAAQGQRR